MWSRAVRICAAPGVVSRLQIGDHQAYVAEFRPPDRNQEIRQRRRGHHRQVGVADALRRRVDEVGRQLIQHDYQRLTLQQVYPGRLSWRGQGRVVVLELLLLAELLRDGAPDAQRRVALASGEGDHADRPESGGRCIEATHDGGSVAGVPREQAEGEQVVGLAAAHGLGQLEHALGGLAFETPESFREQRLHSLGDVILREELGWVDAVVDQVGEVENSVPPRRVEGTRPGSACLLYGLHKGISCSLMDDCSTAPFGARSPVGPREKLTC